MEALLEDEVKEKLGESLVSRLSKKSSAGVPAKAVVTRQDQILECLDKLYKESKK